MLQALSEELSRKAATLVLENENLKRVWYYSVLSSYYETTFSVFLLYLLPPYSVVLICMMHLF